MTEITDDLEEIADEATKLAARLESNRMISALDQLESAVDSAAKAWSGSWLGYHSRVYYKDLQPVPPGARFDPTWGSQGLGYTVGDWLECSFDSVYENLRGVILESDFAAIADAADDADSKVRELRESLLSILESVGTSSDDSYLMRLVEEVIDTKPISATKFEGYIRPSGKFYSNDMPAIQAGLQTPPHIALLAQVKAMQSPFVVARTLAKLATRAGRHMLNMSRVPKLSKPGTKVFIGHGRDTSWRDVKDFIQDRLKLPWDEFNRVAVAGVTNTDRLAEMLGDAAIAFLVMTAEDEQRDGTKRARMNVIHEAGLFQGRLGFSRAIVVFEEGCEEFSNIQGLGQIRFPVGDIKACFEQIRQVLERECLLDG